MVSIDLSSTRQKVLIVVPLILLVSMALAVNFADVPLNGYYQSKSAKPKPITHCQTISKSGNYVIKKNFGGATHLAHSCLVINASHVTIDGAGHTIKGRGVTDTTGVLVSNDSGVSDVTIHSVKVVHWNRAIHVSNGSSVTIRNVSAVRSTEGITLWASTDVVVKRSWVAHNLFGVVVGDRSTRVDLSTVHYRDNQMNSTQGRGRL